MNLDFSTGILVLIRCGQGALALRFMAQGPALGVEVESVYAGPHLVEHVNPLTRRVEDQMTGADSRIQGNAIGAVRRK